MMCPYCKKQFRAKYSDEGKKKRRYSLILKYLDKPKPAAKLYWITRRKGYPLKRQSFDADLKRLEKEGKLDLIKKYTREYSTSVWVLPIEQK